MINIFRKYLLSIHRFNLQFAMNESKSVERTFTIVGLTLYFIVLWVESYTGLHFIRNKFTAFILIFPVIFFILPFYFWYLNNLPHQADLDDGKEKYSGIIILIITAILALFFRKYYI
jgi:hypothetical protein